MTSIIDLCLLGISLDVQSKMGVCIKCKSNSTKLLLKFLDCIVYLLNPKKIFLLIISRPSRSISLDFCPDANCQPRSDCANGVLFVECSFTRKCDNSRGFINTSVLLDGIRPNRKNRIFATCILHIFHISD